MSCSVSDMTLMINSRDMTPCSLVDIQPTKVSDYPKCKSSTFLQRADTCLPSHTSVQLRNP